jgi:hypothetical protein
MTNLRNTQQFSEFDMMLLRAGWNPLLEHTMKPRLRPVRRRIECAICKRLALVLRATAQRLENRVQDLATVPDPV